MATSSIFNELTNRLTQNKRHDSGIHNSSENITENRSANSRTEDQTDSGRESDHAYELRKSKENIEKTKKKGIFNNIKKMFKKKTIRKSKGGALSKSDENLSSNYYKSASEPDITKKLEENDDSKYKRQDIDLMSEPEDFKSPERSRSSLKEAPQYIRSSLRKLRLNKNKKSSNSNIEVSVTDTKKPSNKDRENADYRQFEVKQKSGNEFVDIKVNESPLPAPSGTVDLNDVSRAIPHIETSAAKDRIRIAPQNRRRPTRYASKKPQGRSPSLSKYSEDDSSFRSSYYSQGPESPSINASSRDSLNKLSNSKTSLSSIGETKKSSIIDLPGGLRKTSSLLGSLEFRKSNLFASQEFKNSSKPDVGEINNSTRPKPIVERHSFSFGRENEPLVESKKPRPLTKPRHLSRQGSELRSKSLGNLADMMDSNTSNVTQTTRQSGASQGSMKNLSYKQPPVNVSSEFTDILNEFQKSREKIFQKGNLKRRESENENIKKDMENDNDRVNDHVNNEREIIVTKKHQGEATFALTSMLLSDTKPKGASNSLLITNDIHLRPSEKKEFVISTSPPSSPKNKSKPTINNKKETTPARNSVELSNVSLRKIPKTSDFHVVSNTTEKSETSVDTKKVSRIPSLKKASKKEEVRIGTPDKNKSFGNDEEKLQLSKVKSIESNEPIKNNIIMSPNTSKDSKIPARKSVKAMSKSSDHSSELSHDKSDVSESKIPAFSRISLKKVPKSSDFHGNDNQPLLTSETKPADVVNKEKSNENHFGFNRSLSISKPNDKPTSNINNEFTFQSRDLVRSKTLPSRDMKRNTPKSPTPASPEHESKIPEWVRIAKQKQQGGETESAVKSSVTTVTTKPQISPDKPKLNARPMSVPKMIPVTNRSVSPNKAFTRSFNTKSEVSKDTCMVCNKTAYMFEKCEVDNHTIHISCAKCDICSRKLNVGAIFINDNKVLCSQHKQ